ncbi:MAG: hypothetical protein ACP5GJ_01005 [Nanopusillaceae archaeon]|jgi:type II secretory pathway pseudopilin PulG
MKKRSIEMAVELIFVILIMLVVAVIVIKLFQQQSSNISKISNTEIQQAVSDCISECQSISFFCSKYETIGQGIIEPQPGYYLCANSVPCSVILQLYGGSNNQCTYEGYPVTPLDCMYIECQYYINTLQKSPEKATSLVFGNYSPLTSFNVQTQTANIYFSAPSQNQILYPGPQQCSGMIPTWITDQVFVALLKVLNYYNTNNGCNLSLQVINQTLYVTGNCSKLNIVNNSLGIPLCEFLLQIPYQQLNGLT